MIKKSLKPVKLTINVTEETKEQLAELYNIYISLDDKKTYSEIISECIEDAYVSEMEQAGALDNAFRFRD